MAMDPNAQAMPAAPEQAAQPGGASQLIADTHSNILKIQELVASKFPEDGAAFAQIAQAFQSAVDGLGQAPGAEKQEAVPASTTPEAGAAKVQPAP